MAEDDVSRRTAALFTWLNQVKSDRHRSLPASAFKAAFEIGQRINGPMFNKDGRLVAWPSLETIASAIGMGERTARDMVKRLEARGHLSIAVGHGPGNPSRYTLTIRQPPASLAENQTGREVPVSSQQNRQDEAVKPAGSGTETGSRLPTNHSNHSSNHESAARGSMELKEGLRVKTDTPLGDQYRRWWSATGQSEPAYSQRTGYYLKPLPPLPADWSVAA